MNTPVTHRNASLVLIIAATLLRTNPIPMPSTTFSGGDCNVTPPMDIHDRVLNTHYMAQARTDFAVDGAVSPFWGELAASDSIALYPPDYAFIDRDVPSSPQDASVSIHAAGDDLGLYILVVVNDNVWLSKQSADDWGTDALMLYMDRLSSSEIQSCTDCLMGLYNTTLSYTTYQFRIWLADSSGFGMSYYDENLWSWQMVGLTNAAAETLFGIKVDRGSLTPTRRFIEMFISWEKYCLGIPYGTEIGGKRFGFAVTYHDKDIDPGSNPKGLSWTGRDPWASDAQEASYWGDLFMTSCGTGPVPLPDAPVLNPYAPDPTTDRTPTLTWRPYNSATNYKIVIDTDPSFASPEVVHYTGGATSYTPTVLLPYDTIYWRVSANTDYGAYSTTDMFVIEEQILPPVLIPCPFDSTTDRTPVLRWQEVSGATRYRVVISNPFSSSAPLVDTIVQGVTSFVPTQPLPLGWLEWTVASSRDYSLFAAREDITILPLPATSIVAPAEMATVSPETRLTWHTVHDPSSTVSYHVVASLSDDLSYGILVDTTMPDTSACVSDLNPAMPHRTMIFWQVTVRADHGAVSSPTPTASFLLDPLGVKRHAADKMTTTLRAEPVAGGTSTAIRYTLSHAAAVRIAVYDLRGALVRTLIDRNHPAGEFSLMWDGSGAAGGRTPSGTYVARMRVDNRVYTTRIGTAR